MVTRKAVADPDVFAAIETDPKARAAWLEVDAARSAAKLMRDARKRLGFSQSDIASALGVSQARISQVESGRVEDIPPLDFLVRYLDACGERMVFSAQPMAPRVSRSEGVITVVKVLPDEETESVETDIAWPVVDR